MTAAVSAMAGRSTGPKIAAFGGTLEYSDPTASYSASATITLETDGTISISGSPALDVDTVGAAWSLSTGAGTGANVWVTATLTAGTAPSTGTTGSPLQLSAARAWVNNYVSASIGSKTSTLRFDFSRTSGGAVVGSATVALIARGGA